MDTDERQKFDKQLAEASQAFMPKPPVPLTSQSSGRKKPAWWPSDEQVSKDNLDAARQMGYAVGSIS